MAGRSRSKNGVASLTYVPAIHVFGWMSKTWMPATSAGMTESSGPPPVDHGTSPIPLPRDGLVTFRVV
jgi:hypothetical protein